MHRAKGSQQELIGLAKDLIAFGRWRSAFAVLLMILGGLLESLSLAFLVPLFAILTNPDHNGFLERTFYFFLPAGASTMTKLASLLLLFLVIMALRTVVVAARDRTIARLQLDYSERLQVRLFEALGAARWQDLEGLKHARITHALGSGIGRVTSATQLLLQASVSLVMLIAQWILTFVIAPAIALIFLLIALVGVLPLVRALSGSSALGREMTSGNLALAHTTTQLLGGLKLSFAQNMQPAFVREYANVAGELKNRRYRFQRGQSTVRAGLTFGAAVAGALLLFFGYLLGIAVARLLAAFAIFARMNTAATTLVQCSQQLTNNAPAHGDLMQLLDELESSRKAQVARPDGTLPEMKIVTFDQVTVGDGPELRLARLSIAVLAGETVGLSGASGAGKTTFLDVLAGLVAVDSGAVLINGQPMDASLAPLWRDRISYVTQDGFLFSESVRRNLAWGVENLSDDQLWEALSIVRMDEVVRRTADGLDTQVSERGIRFSGGERQRIALARAILRNPVVLILDEATNAIDVETESLIFDGLAKARPALTIVVVAHRPSTLAMCDRIVRLENGRVIDDGRHTAPEVVAQ